jgi:hypothetical protein
VSTTLATSSTSSHFGGGPSIQFAILDRLALSVDVFYRRAGYSAGSQTYAGVDDPDTSEDERDLTTTSEETTADYWDVPILARIYNVSRHKEGPRVFFGAGIAFRRAINIRSFRQITHPDGLSDTDETPVTPVSNSMAGIVVGGGAQLMDDFGLKVVPEVRFTKWFDRTFSAAPTQSSRNQLEVVLGFTW